MEIEKLDKNKGLQFGNVPIIIHSKVEVEKTILVAEQDNQWARL